MAGTAVRGRLTWRLATVADVVAETPRVSTLLLDEPAWPGHRAGQHVDVRLTAEDGYQAQRSYSISSAPEAGALALTVERLDDGEVSPYLVGELRTGDQLELRGPIGGYFTWDVADGGPLLLVSGGSGIAPLMAMIRHRVATGSGARVRLLASWRTPEDVIFAGELQALAARAIGIEIVPTYTRAAPPGWTGYARRIDETMLEDVGWGPDAGGTAYVCGSTGLVEQVASALVSLGYPPAEIRTERFGATGG